MAADHIAHIEVVYENGYEKHQVIPECDIPENIFSEGELEVLERIDAKFKDFGSVDISNYSHKEKGYCATKKAKLFHMHMQKTFNWIASREQMEESPSVPPPLIT